MLLIIKQERKKLKQTHRLKYKLMVTKEEGERGVIN